jgi:hypothetical protein
MKITFEREKEEQKEIHLVKVSDGEGKASLAYPEVPAITLDKVRQIFGVLEETKKEIEEILDIV